MRRRARILLHSLLSKRTTITSKPGTGAGCRLLVLLDRRLAQCGPDLGGRALDVDDVLRLLGPLRLQVGRGLGELVLELLLGVEDSGFAALRSALAPSPPQPDTGRLGPGELLHAIRRRPLGQLAAGAGVEIDDGVQHRLAAQRRDAVSFGDLG